MTKPALQRKPSVGKEDNFVQLVGHFGNWQLLIISTISLVKFASAWVLMAILFLTPTVTFWCVEFEDSNDIVTVDNSTCYSNCARYEYIDDPMDNSIVSEWDLICDRAWLASFTQTLLQFGVLLGSIVFGFFSDRYGRKNTYLFSIMSLIIITFGIPFSPNYIVFTALRFFQGAAIAGTMVVSFVIVMETAGTRYRELLGCVYQVPFVLGHASMALFAYYFRTWKTYTFALAVPQIIYLGYFFVLHESPRWLVSVGRVEEATKIVEKVAKMNKLPTSNIEETLTKLSKDITSTTKPKVNYSELFKKSLRLKSISLIIMWLIIGLTFYGFNQYISQTSPDPFVSVAVAGVIQVPANLASIWLIKSLGRKRTTSGFFFLSGVCIIALGFVPKTYAVTLALGTLGVSFSSVVATSIYIYTSELYPTVVRNMGMGLCSMSMRIGSMIAPFVSNLSATSPWAPIAIFGLAPIIACIACIPLPETKGMKLPDSIQEVED